MTSSNADPVVANNFSSVMIAVIPTLSGWLLIALASTLAAMVLLKLRA